MAFTGMLGAGSTIAGTVGMAHDSRNMGRSALTEKEMWTAGAIALGGVFFAVRDRKFMPLIVALGAAGGFIYLCEHFYNNHHQPERSVVSGSWT